MASHKLVPPPESELQKALKYIEILAENEMTRGYELIQGTEGLRLMTKECLENLNQRFSDNSFDARAAARQTCLQFAALSLIWALQVESGPPYYSQTYPAQPALPGL